MKINSVTILGTGRMGSTIAVAMARVNMKVTIVSRRSKNKALYLIKQRLTRQMQNGEITLHEKNNILENILGTTDVRKAKDSQLVIETIIEDINAKKRLFRRLDALCLANTIFASNTSSLSIAEISKATRRKHKFLGLHFFYPADKMKLIEIVTTPAVSQETINSIKLWAQKIMKETVLVDDIPGFIVNRLIFPLINEAVNMVEKNTASPEEIDKAMQLGLNWPIGPLALADVIGLDICLSIMKSLYARIGEKKYKPSTLLIKKVRNGYLGKKNKCGFYNY